MPLKDVDGVPIDPAFTPATPVVRDMVAAVERRDKGAYVVLSNRLNEMVRDGICTEDDVELASWDTGATMAVADFGGVPEGKFSADEFQVFVDRGLERMEAEGWI